MSSSEGEKEWDLWLASRRYVRGEISLDELEGIELLEAEKLKRAICVLARYYTRRPLLDFFHKIIKKSYSKGSI